MDSCDLRAPEEPTDRGPEDRLAEWKEEHGLPAPRSGWRRGVALFVKGLLLLAASYAAGWLLLPSLFGFLIFGPRALVFLLALLLVIIGIGRSMAASFSRH